jgi:hypothetical protein
VSAKKKKLTTGWLNRTIIAMAISLGWMLLMSFFRWFFTIYSGKAEGSLISIRALDNRFFSLVSGMKLVLY